MKLDAAAVFAGSLSYARLGFGFPTVVATGLLFLASSAMALDGIDLSHPSEAGDEAGCPELVRIKYPFLRCTNGEIGSAAGDEKWDMSRKIPIMSPWTEGDGYWGPDLNEGS